MVLQTTRVHEPTRSNALVLIGQLVPAAHAVHLKFADVEESRKVPWGLHPWGMFSQQAMGHIRTGSQQV